MPTKRGGWAAGKRETETTNAIATYTHTDGKMHASMYARTHALTCAGEEAGSVHFTNEELKADDGVDDDDKQDQQGDVEERNHGFNNGVQHNL